LITLTTILASFAMSGQPAVVTDFFENQLHLTRIAVWLRSSAIWVFDYLFDRAVLSPITSAVDDLGVDDTSGGCC
jgi:hypothetical protein